MVQTHDTLSLALAFKILDSSALTRFLLSIPIVLRTYVMYVMYVCMLCMYVCMYVCMALRIRRHMLEHASEELRADREVAVIIIVIIIIITIITIITIIITTGTTIYDITIIIHHMIIIIIIISISIMISGPTARSPWPPCATRHTYSMLLMYYDSILKPISIIIIITL